MELCALVEGDTVMYATGAGVDAVRLVVSVRQAMMHRGGSSCGRFEGEISYARGRHTRIDDVCMRSAYMLPCPLLHELATLPCEPRRLCSWIAGLWRKGRVYVDELVYSGRMSFAYRLERARSW